MLIFAQVCGCVLMLGVGAVLIGGAITLIGDALDRRRDAAHRRHSRAACLVAANQIKHLSWWFSEDAAVMEGFRLAGEFIEGNDDIGTFREEWRKKRQAPKEQP